MRLLVLGGTLFLGRHLVEAALARGHAVTLFTRGRTGAELFPEAERREGDRGGDLAALAGGAWDAVVDTSGQLPRHVRASARSLAPRVEHYTFVSSISVYRDFGSRGRAHGAGLCTMADPESVEEPALEHYGALKAASERAVAEELGGRCLSVRPGLIVGPHDPSDRFSYWPSRMARGGEVLAPSPRERRVQVIDARDLASFLLDAAEARLPGTLDATGPAEPLSMGELVDTCREVAGSEAEISWVDEDFLLEQGVGPFMELPLWVPGTDAVVDVSEAVAAGLRFRPLRETVRDTLEWTRSLPADRRPRAGLAPRREAELLGAWRDRNPS